MVFVSSLLSYVGIATWNSALGRTFASNSVYNISCFFHFARGLMHFSLSNH